MKVKHLIEELQKFDGEKEVKVVQYLQGYSIIRVRPSHFEINGERPIFLEIPPK